MYVSSPHEDCGKIVQDQVPFNVFNLETFIHHDMMAEITISHHACFFFKITFSPMSCFFFNSFFGECYLVLPHKRIALPDSPKTSFLKGDPIPTESRHSKGHTVINYFLYSVLVKDIVPSPAELNSSTRLPTGCAILDFSEEESLMSRIGDLFKGSQVFRNQQLGHFLLHYSPLTHALLKTEYGSSSLPRF